MSFFTAIGVALRALLVHKGRSALTSLGIVIGISAVIAMVAAGSGAREALDERLGSIGKNMILIRAGKRTQQGTVTEYVPFRNADAEALRKQLVPSLLTAVAESQFTQRMVSSRTGNWPTSIVGSVPSLQQVRGWKMASGRFLSQDDLDKQAAVCLLGQTSRRRLFGANPSPLGELIRIGPLPVRVIGILEPKGRMPTGEDQDDQVMLPITTLQHRLVGLEGVNLIVAQGRSPELMESAMQRITEILRQRHRIKPGAAADFDVTSVQERAAMAHAVSMILSILIAVIASISLVVGGIGIMNIMLVSVTERTREIGIRLAVGATAFDVLLQFLIEAVVLAMIGGVLGITLGLGVAVLLAHLRDWPLIIDPGIILLAFGVAAAVGVFFGYYPALKASRLDPIDALRYE